MANILELTNVSKSYRDVQVLNNLDFHIEKGRAVAILGPSGAGKSTLLHIAGLMDHPTSGTVSIDGRSANHLSEKELARLRLDTVGFVFQFHYLLADFDVLENVLIPCRFANDDLAVRKKEALELLEKLKLSHRLTHRPQELSGGEQQRAAFARALIRRPALLLCDEPTGNLDPHTADEMMSIVWSEVAARNLTTIIVTHNEAVAKRTNVAYHLRDGRFN
jgi:lipoprotein-releasing system ATP-binding protein